MSGSNVQVDTMFVTLMYNRSNTHFQSNILMYIIIIILCETCSTNHCSNLKPHLVKQPITVKLD